MTDRNTSAESAESVEDVLMEMKRDASACEQRGHDVAYYVVNSYADRIKAAYTRERANSSVTIPLTVELSADGDTFIAHAAGINYVASGANGDEARRNFARGLMATLAAHVERMREPSKLLDAANSSESPKGLVSAQGEVEAVDRFLHFFESRGESLFFSFGWEGVDLYNAAVKARRLTSAQPEARIDFPGIGHAGPLPVVNGEITLPDVTMADLAYHFRMGWGKEQPAAVKDCLTTQQAADAKDAARYRWLRNDSNFANRHAPAVVSCPLDDAMKSILCDKELDAAIDAAMSAGENTNG